MPINYQKVKLFMGITDSYQDETLIPIIDEVAQYMAEAGVSKSVIEAEGTCGVLARGALDIWNYGSGQVSFSPLFQSRVTQLSLKEDSNNG